MELDKKLPAVLAETLAVYDNVTIVPGDILKVNIRELMGDQPFKVAGQYEKYTGSQVEILFADGKKRKGILAGFSQGVITFTWSALERVEEKKRRVPVEHTDMVDLKEIKWCKPVIDFK